MAEKLCLIIMAVISAALIMGIIFGASVEELAAGIMVMLAVCLSFLYFKNRGKGGKP